MMAQARSRPRSWTASQIAFTVLMLGLTALFVMLGTWQVQRLDEKEALIATVEARFDEAPAAFPDPALWEGMDPEALDYRRYGVTGVFDHPSSVLVFTNLTDPRGGPYRGAGYWVMTPFELAQGGLVWVNRGFVPQEGAQEYAGTVAGSDEPVTIEAIARRPERAGTFTPEPDFAARREWVRDPQRLSAFLDAAAGQIAPVTLDAVAGPPGTLPQGGETQIAFPNRHLEYAGTWYLFAAITPVMLGFWLWRQRRPTDLAHKDKAD